MQHIGAGDPQKQEGPQGAKSDNADHHLANRSAFGDATKKQTHHRRVGKPPGPVKNRPGLWKTALGNGVGPETDAEKIVHH